MLVPARPRRKGIARERWGVQGEASPRSEEGSRQAEEGRFRRGDLPLRPTGGWVEPRPDGDASGQDPSDRERILRSDRRGETASVSPPSA